MSTRLRVATSGPFASAIDIGGPGAVGNFLRRVANPTAGQPDTVDWAAVPVPPPTRPQSFAQVQAAFQIQGGIGLPIAAPAQGASGDYIADSSADWVFDATVSPRFTYSGAIRAFLLSISTDISSTHDPSAVKAAGPEPYAQSMPTLNGANIFPVVYPAQFALWEWSPADIEAFTTWALAYQLTLNPGDVIGFSASANWDIGGGNVDLMFGNGPPQAFMGQDIHSFHLTLIGL